MKLLRRLLLIVLVLAIAVPVIAFAELWMSAGAAIARAQQTGLLVVPSNNAPLNVAERTIAIDQFRGAWNVRANLCRNVDDLWQSATNGARGPRSRVTVSGALSSQILLRLRPESTLRWHLLNVAVNCQLERRYSDTEMLRAWLSNAYFGPRPFGIDNAAQNFFGKSAGDLNLEESARLAALLYGPSIRNDPGRWAQRADRINERVANYEGPL